ncbi:MAG TPA: hypothetical protein VNE63_03390 [Candidatus Acidoferrales bacterium]|nr:hypothetical protein [Candidatus Acidoferrales bacterium]
MLASIGVLLLLFGMYAFFALRMAKGEIIALLAVGFLLVVTQFAKRTKSDASAAVRKGEANDA